ncbi:MAG: tetratricopeptide (TPR) repeat protein [Halieaceae bacterium]|jgi:tetratricopeptide (TPR) repeat protein
MTETSSGVYQQAIAQTQEMLKAQEFELALTQIEAILEVHAADAKTHLLKGIALRNLGRHEEAVAVLGRLAAGTRGVASVHQELGLSLYALRRVDAAIKAFRAAVEIDPKLAGSWHKLGELLYRGGDADEEAEQAFRNAMAATHTHPGILKALDLISQEQYGMAEGICRDYLQRFPVDVSVIRLLAEIGLKLGVRGDPEILLKQCLEMAPDYHLARNTYANALSQAQKYEQALAEIDYLEKVEPENPSHSMLAASIQIMIGAYEEAEQRYGRLAGRMPHFAQMQNNHGHTLKTLGRLEDAIAAYRRAIAIESRYGDAYWNLANLKTFRFESDEIEQMRTAIAAEQNSPRDYYHLCFALGKALEDLEQFDESFRYYELGNAAKCKEEGYSAEDNHAAVQALITTCTPELIQNKAGYGCEAPDPIFIVGLPRSGSTLLEQILASHSLVDGTSELREMISIARRLGGKKNKVDESLYPGALLDLSENDCRELGEEYLERTRVQRRGAPYFIDKMPNNFEHVALISTILPNAKIIDSRRHPMASCFSGFKQLFEAGQTFTYSQTDMACYYRDYTELMDHWDDILPGKVLRVNYERVITDTETEVRRILDYCGLPFEESCLTFYSTKRAVHTASSEQVRQPIYTSAVEQWRHFDRHLGPMRSELRPLIVSQDSL